MVDYIRYINNNVEPSRRIEYAKGLVDYYKSIKPYKHLGKFLSHFSGSNFSESNEIEQIELILKSYLPKATKSSKRIVIIGEKRYSY